MTSFLLTFFVDICQDLSYGARWSQWAIWPIFQAKRSSEWRSGFSMTFLPKLFMDVCKDFSYVDDLS
ncbi:hypothetical protein H5410_056451 [Solanum commersonii]|uniref:Uncharacterized protein n=1 Tax=Solanum commersonii TaxID=4109 RepID=A0A9J5WLR4_SOLCO|nr:hypothetical protein H5410_056451 [Solanum commersonii]